MIEYFTRRVIVLMKVTGLKRHSSPVREVGLSYKCIVNEAYIAYYSNCGRDLLF